jgi:hypothetical protein
MPKGSRVDKEIASFQDASQSRRTLATLAPGVTLPQSSAMETDLIQGNTGRDYDCAIELLDRGAILIKYTYSENTKEWDYFDTG